MVDWSMLCLIALLFGMYFPHTSSYLDSVLTKYPTKFAGCCLANPAEDGSGIEKLEQLVLKV